MCLEEHRLGENYLYNVDSAIAGDPIQPNPVNMVNFIICQVEKCITFSKI